MEVAHVTDLNESPYVDYREADRVILTMCQEQGAQPQTFSIISQQLGNKTPSEVRRRSLAGASSSRGTKQRAWQEEDRLPN